MSDSNVILSVRKLCKSFGGIMALNKLDIDIYEGCVHGIIGPNGAGKSTLFNVISGFVCLDTGRVFYRGDDITDIPAEEIAALGISRTFQQGKLVQGLNVLENVMSGILSQETDIIKSFFLRPFSYNRREGLIKEKAVDCLDFVGMRASSHRWAGELVWVERQLVQIARALVSEPQLLLLDEPTAGMGERETGQVADIIRRLMRRQITVILVSHDLKFVMDLCDRVTVLDFGKKISEGTPEEIRNDPGVLEAYIGE